MAKVITVDALLAANDAKGVIEKLSFEEGLRLLEELVKQVEGGTLALEQSILCYERGSALAAHLRGLISGAEQKLKILQAGGGVSEG